MANELMRRCLWKSELSPEPKPPRAGQDLAPFSFAGL